MNKVLLIILDGFGCRKEFDGNAIKQADKPFFDELIKDYPYTLVETSGEAVGLIPGQMGNSEVGHMNIGSGRIVYQDSMRIHKSIESGDFYTNEVLLNAINHVKTKKSKLHLIGLLSDGGVHSHQDHLYALLKFAAKEGLTDVLIHVFTDGRDTSPTSGIDFINQLEDQIKTIGVGKIASVSGRYYSMDRDKRWERVELAYQAMIGQSNLLFHSASEGIETSYQSGKFDEFIEPFIVSNQNEQIHTVQSSDVIISFNYRSDRLRQISRVFADPNFTSFKRKDNVINFVQFTEYDAKLPLKTVFPAQKIAKTLGEIISANGLKQLRAAETEKYAHVTFFLNGGVETIFAGEQRILVDSPKVDTYDLQPEMSAYQLTDKLEQAVAENKYQLIVCNYANSDMVGHTGIFSAAVKAIETLDQCLARLVKLAKKNNYKIIITSDHGNAEQMIDPLTNQAFTQHTIGPVPLIVVDDSVKTLTSSGRLCDVAPTILDLMNIDQPIDMTGRSLIKKDTE